MLLLGAAAGCGRASHAQPVPHPSPAPVSPPSPAAPALPVAAPARPAIPPDLNVVMISIDSLRADMPWAGYARAIAPFLTALEARSVSYTHAYALSSYTSQSVGGFLGGRLPGELKRDGYFFGTYPSRVLFFPERLRAAGIHTVAAQAHGYFRPGAAGFDQGFETWRMVPGLHWNPTTDVDVTGDRHADLAMRLLGDPRFATERFFAWFHFMDPHDEYRAHPGIGPYGRSMRDRYDAEVTYADQQVRRLVEWIGTQPFGARTAIIVTADHGEGFGEHGHYRHGFELWQNLVRVPWFFVVPGVAPRRIDENRSHLDLAPTVLALFGLPPEPEFTGVSLVPELLGAAPESRDVWVDLARTSNNDRRRALLHGSMKILAFGDDTRFSLFDVAQDPGELHDRARTDRPTFEAMRARYREAQTHLRDEHPTSCRTLTGAPPGRAW